MISRNILLAAAVAIWLATAALAASVDPASIRYEHGKVWMNVHDAPPGELLKALAKKTGVRFVVDAEVKPGPISLTLEGMPLERAIRNLIAAMPQAAGHTMTYAPGRKGGTRLVKVSLFGAGKTAAGENASVYGDGEEPSMNASIAPIMLPTPNLDERMDKMIAAGVPRETAEKVINLTREVQKLQATPRPGTYKPEDLSPDSRAKLGPLVERGVPMERAVQMLLLQERYQDTLKDLQSVPNGASAMPGAAPPSSE